MRIHRGDRGATCISPEIPDLKRRGEKYLHYEDEIRVRKIVINL